MMFAVRLEAPAGVVIRILAFVSEAAHAVGIMEVLNVNWVPSALNTIPAGGAFAVT